LRTKLYKPWYKIVKPGQPRDYRTITALSLGIGTIMSDNPSDPWFNYYLYRGCHDNTHGLKVRISRWFSLGQC